MPPERTSPSGPDSPRSPIPSWISVAAAVLILFAAYTAFQVWRSGREVADLARRVQREQARRRALEAQRQRYEDALRIIADPVTRKIELRPASSALPVVAAYWNPQLGLALAGSGLPPPAAGNTLELWIQSGEGNLVGAAIFQPGARGQILVVVPPAGAAGSALRIPKRFSISEEPTGGSAFPTSTLTWTARLP